LKIFNTLISDNKIMFKKRTTYHVGDSIGVAVEFTNDFFHVAVDDEHGKVVCCYS
jgi:hypothetical protein